ncbi:zinc finger C2HC domain-containing protein 1A-like isoform X4 [Ostrea edulis]|uniref:zinc finger C2HC domain-containing protein 1A-like isoform X4 n=1 Tax=Ostrea edulis TaxID=37623 RepID=UPI0024AF9012|nr:zinc finger C2HC domain-containing protein 1A-like isoform X4 [Ostrea edulis]
MEDYEANRNVVRKPCRQCGRQFVPESLVKHEPTCIKAAHKRRKVFDSSKQRSEGTEVTHRQIKQAQKKEVKPPKSNWRAKHEDFINTVRSARGVSLAMQRGEPLPPPPPPSINPDYVQCPYCSRRFNEKAAERHINFCKTQQQRIPNKPKADPRAAAKQNVRTQYQPPKPKTKTESSPGYGGAGTRGSPGAPVGRGRGVGGTPPSVSGRQPNSYARGRSTTTTTNTYQDSDHGDDSLFDGNGRALRTGRDGRAYQEARREIHSAGIKNSSNNRLMRGANKGTSSPGVIHYGLKESESGYYSSSSDNDHINSYTNVNQERRKNSLGKGGAKFCHECGTKYPLSEAKFCCECGVKRMALT